MLVRYDGAVRPMAGKALPDLHSGTAAAGSPEPKV